MRASYLWYSLAVIAFCMCQPLLADLDEATLDEVSIVVLGRSKSGVTSTVRQLLGPQTVVHDVHEAVASTDVLEYTVRINAPPGDKDYYYLKIIDVPGLDCDQTLEHDVEILTTLKVYLEDKGLPTFFLVVSRLDDHSIQANQFQFVQLLKRIEYFQRALFETTTDNTVFLLPRLLNEPKESQTEPAVRISQFRSVIQQSTTFPSAVEIVYGDNKPEDDPENLLKIEHGFYQLSNNELYPKNVWEKLLDVAQSTSVATQSHKNAVTKHVIQSMIENREKVLHSQELVAHVEDEENFEEDSKALEYLLRQDNIDLPCNEVQRRLQSVRKNEEASIELNSCLQFLALMVELRNMEIKSLRQLPQTVLDQVNFYQKGSMHLKYAVLNLKHALDMHMPQYPLQNLAVGYGYDVINDESLTHTPYATNIGKPSPLGYSFPDFVRCKILANVEEKSLANVTESADEYYQERLRNLGLSQEITTLSQLKGKQRLHLNMMSNGDNNLLTGVREVRILECNLVGNTNTTSFDNHFLTQVNSLPQLNVSDFESLETWKLFLHTFGTHIVSKGYGGGFYQGELMSLNGNGTSLMSRNNIEQTLDDIMKFENLNIKSENDARILTYYFQGGKIDPSSYKIHELNQSLRDSILEEWKHSLKFQFQMLKNELQMISISEIIAFVNTTKGEETKSAINLLLQGKLDANEVDQTQELKTQMIKAKAQALVLQAINFQKAKERLEKFNQFINNQTM